MKTKLLTSFLICFLSFCLPISVTACPPPSCPDCYTGSACDVYICGCFPSPIGFSVWPSTNNRYVCIDDKVTFSAWSYTWDGDGCSLIYSWDFGRDAYDTSEGDSDWEYCRYSSVGDRTVTLNVTRVTIPNSCCSTPRTDSYSRTVTAVEVASLLPDVGTEIDDGDGDPDTKSFVVCIADSGVVTVTATPNPVVSEQNLPGYGYTWGWTLTGGTGTSKLVRTVSRTTPAKTILTCTCGSSSKTTRIYVVKVDVDAGLSELNEINPGKYINVNWDDDDSDGWAPNDTPPNGVYTGDKDDPNIKGGDNDFRSFIVSISPFDIPADFPETMVSVTFPNKVKVWETNTKKKLEFGEMVSSELSSGAQFKVANLPKQFYLEGVSGSGAFRDVDLKATYVPCGANDIVKVTVFEVTLAGLFGFGPQQPIEENDKRHSTFKCSSNKNGRISWDDANADGTKGDLDPNCEYFHNCMECQGAVEPSGVTNEVEFDIKRSRWGKCWKKSGGGTWGIIDDSTPWQPDDAHNQDEDLTPSATNHIYSQDGPGFRYKSIEPGRDSVAMIADFREWVTVKIDGSWYQCSNFYKWHAKTITEPKNDTEMTRASMDSQLLGGAWIIVPDSP